MALTTTGDIAPEWVLGLCCGLGGPIGGYLQPHLPETGLHWLLLGVLAIALAGIHLDQTIS